MYGALIDPLRIERKVLGEVPESCWKATEKLRDHSEHFSTNLYFLCEYNKAFFEFSFCSLHNHVGGCVGFI